MPYDKTVDGCIQLAKEARAANVSNEDFDWYQEAYKKVKKRKKSSIPAMKITLDDGMSGEIIRLDDINNLLAGEKTDCCQRYGQGQAYGVGCMKHAAFSDSGRILIVRNKENEILGQSWIWFNDNTLCFDNFEATNRYKVSIDPRNGLRNSFNKYKESLKKLYLRFGEELIEKSKSEVEKYEKTNSFKDCNSLKIKSVTIGTGNDDSGFLHGMKKGKFKKHKISYKWVRR